MAYKKYKKKASRTWMFLTFLITIVVLILAIALLKSYGIVSADLTVQENWASFWAWWNSLQFVIDIKSWF